MRLGKLKIYRTDPIDEYDNVMRGWWISWGTRILFRRIDKIGKWQYLPKGLTD